MDKNELSTLHDLASLGHIYAIDKLVKHYLDVKDYKNAFLVASRYEFFSSSDGFRTLGYFYQKGIGVEPNTEKAYKYYLKSYELGDYSSGYSLALIHYKKKEYNFSLSYLINGTENNHISSIKLLANMYLNGEGVMKNSDIAINLFKKAINLGDETSIDSLARLYYSLGDYSNSFKYFSIGASHNIPDSIYHLGLSYAKGLGTKQDFVKAKKYYEIGANLLEPRCLYNLSLYYRKGIVVMQNEELANKLEAQAIENGFKK